MTSQTSESKVHKTYLEEDMGRKGIFKWILSTDHKRIGLLYLYSMMVWFTVGVVLGLLMKLELIAPGKTLMGPQAYNATFTVHGVIMIFLIVIPGLPGQGCGLPKTKPVFVVHLYTGLNTGHHLLIW